MQFLFGPVIGALSRPLRPPPGAVDVAGRHGGRLPCHGAGADRSGCCSPRASSPGSPLPPSPPPAPIIADITPPDQRGRRFGLIGACFGVGFVLGPLIGGLLAAIDLRAPFYAAAGAGAGQPRLRLVRPARDGHRRHPPPVHAVPAPTRLARSAPSPGCRACSLPACRPSCSLASR